MIDFNLKPDISRMENQKKSPKWLLFLLIVVVANGLVKNFDPSTLTFQKPYLCLLYGLVLVAGLYLFIRDLWAKKKDAE